MGSVIDVVEYTKIADPAWEGRLKTAKMTLTKRTIPAYIEFCQEVHAFRDHCDSSQGGSEFSKKGCEWLGCSKQRLSEWSAVGRRATELSGATGKLPASEDAIARLASLDDIAFPKALERLEPDMSQKDVKELINEIRPSIEKPENDLDEAHRRLAIKIVKQIQTLPKNFQFVVWDSIRDAFSEDSA